MDTSWSGLLADLAIVAMFVSVWIHGHVWIERWSAPVRSVAFGSLMGLGAITVMLNPVNLMPGVQVDLRLAFIALSGFFGGPIACLVTGSMAMALRFHEGGVGAFSGIVSILAAMIITVAGHLLLRGRQPGRLDIVVIAAAVAAGSRLGLVVAPQPIVEAYMKSVALPSSLLDFAAIVLAGLALYQERRRIEALRSKIIYQAIVDALPDCLNAKDTEGRFMAANPATARLMRAPDRQSLIGKTDFDFYPDEAARKFRLDEEALLRSGDTSTIEQRFDHGDGMDVWLSTLKAPLTDQHGRIIGLITHNRDVTVQKILENELSVSRIRLTDALTHMADGLVMFDESGKLLLCNEQYRQIFPRTADLRVPGAQHRDILRASAERGEQQVPGEDIDAWIDGIAAAHRAADDRDVQLCDGRWVNIRTRPTAEGGTLSMISDITLAKRNEAELVAVNKKLNHLANRDGLTDLWTRRAFDEALDREFGRSRRTGAPLSLILVDVDWFKRFNDTYGHPAGDECLRAVSRCIQATVRRPTDVAARYGGEEFAIILPETDVCGAFGIAEALHSAARALEIEHNGSEKKIVTLSIGVATFDASAETMDVARLLRRADEQLYAAKAAGRDCVRGFQPEAAKPVRLATHRRWALAGPLTGLRQARPSSLRTSAALLTLAAPSGPAIGFSGQNTVCIPAASPAVAPVTLSSMTKVSAGSIPVSHAARRNGSACGLPSRTSLRLTDFRPGSTRPTAPRLASTTRRSELDTTACTTPALCRSRKISSAPSRGRRVTA